MLSLMSSSSVINWSSSTCALIGQNTQYWTVIGHLVDKLHQPALHGSAGPMQLLQQAPVLLVLLAGCQLRQHVRQDGHVGLGDPQVVPQLLDLFRRHLTGLYHFSVLSTVVVRVFVWYLSDYRLTVVHLSHISNCTVHSMMSRYGSAGTRVDI